MAAPRNPAFFVVGVGRSGTTLVRAIISGHHDVEIPGETGFLPTLLRLRRLWWGRGGVRDAIFVRLVFANGRLERAGLARSLLREMLAEQRPATPAEAVGAIYNCFGRMAGATIVGDKTPGYVDQLGLLANTFPDAAFLHVVRHPLDTISSLVTQPWGPTSVRAAAVLWARSMRYSATAVPPHRRMLVRLEDIVEQPDSTLTAIADHLGLTVESAMFDFARRADRIASQNIHPASHGGLSGGLSRTRDWRRDLSQADARLAWSLVRAQAEPLGYSGPVAPVAPASARVRALASLVWFRLQRARHRVRTLRRIVTAR